MRHHKQITKFNRPANQRRALLAGLARSLFLQGRIKTTEAKAKALRPKAERLITYGKQNTLAANRRLEAVVGEQARLKVTRELVERYRDRSGGYTRIIKLPSRTGDAAPMAYIELI